MGDILIKRFHTFVFLLYLAFLLYCGLLPEALFGTGRAAAKVSLNVNGMLAIMFLMAGLGQLLVSPFIYWIKERIHDDTSFKSGPVDIPAIMGYLESFLYPAALLMKAPLFIGLWLTLKAAGEWAAWKDEEKGIHTHRTFLIGSGLMILWGLITYGLIVSTSLG